MRSGLEVEPLACRKGLGPGWGAMGVEKEECGWMCEAVGSGCSGRWVDAERGDGAGRR